MSRWIKQTLAGLTIAGIIIMVLLILNWKQELARRKMAAEVAVVQQTLVMDRNSADRLLNRLDGLKKLRDDLVMPQVELRIKF